DRISRRFYMLPILFSLSVTVLAMTAWMLHSDTRRQIDELGTATSDSTQWFLAQTEVELMALQRAAMLVRAKSATDSQLDDLRRRFDIFYSRVQTLRNGRTFANLRKLPEASLALQELQQRLEETVPAIDGGDAHLLADLPALERRMERAIPVVRQVSLLGVRSFAEDADTRRLSLVATLHQLSLMVLPLFTLLVGATVVLFVMFRSARIQNLRLAAARDRMRSLYDASIDAILVARPDGRIRGYNRAAQRIYGYEPDEIIGGDVVEMLTPPDQRDTVRSLLAEVQSGRWRGDNGEPKIIQASARHKSGRVIPVELSLSATFDSRGPLLVAFVRDVSRRALEEAELVDARDRALAGEKAKARMIAVMSHEMRTPLNGVLGTLELLKQTPLDSRQHQYLGAMEHSGRMLLRHVNDVLDASRAAHGTIPLNNAPMDLQALICSTVNGLRAHAEARGNRLTATFQGDHHRALVGDAARIEQIVVNLIGNAIKFTTNGLILVELDRSAGAGHVELRVIDTGIGIAEDDLPRIFDEFVTLDATFDREVQGTGLGLSIVKSLVDAMNGEIDVVSDPGEGTVFSVTLDLPVSERPGTVRTAPAIGVVARAASRVLVVDDNETNRLIVREMLRLQDCAVIEACDGLAGVQAAAEEPFDLILMDISMPRMNGIDAARQIRTGGPNMTTRIVALTAHALPEDLEQFTAAGMDGALVKPLQMSQLVSLLDQPAPDGQVVAATDLAATLGAAQAEALILRIVDELRTGLQRLMLGEADSATLVHRLAGSAAIGGLHEVRLRLAQLETALRLSAEPVPIAAEAARLLTMLDRFSPPDAQDRASCSDRPGLAITITDVDSPPQRQETRTNENSDR
ncbi:MAG: response regulator, partial [Alphaproteobacteria bacterium]|nr:response regulator [Alphaproteobacteria bacterium]